MNNRGSDVKDLTTVDSLVRGAWAQPVTWRQPIHTVYIPAEQVTSPEIYSEWAQRGLETLDRLSPQNDLKIEPHIAQLAIAKMHREPIEDVRIDFEDGFTQRAVSPDERDADEDTHAKRCGGILAEWLAQGVAGASISEETTTTPTPPPFAGARIKSMDPAVRDRGLRTLRILLSELADNPQAVTAIKNNHRVIRLTLPKVQHHVQVGAFVRELEKLESEFGLPKLHFEVQIETPQAIICPLDGAMEPARIIQAGEGRVMSFHYGTYDYSASMGVDAAWQSMEHPVADFAKDVLQNITAGSGIELSDGSTNRIPAGSRENHLEAWATHLRLVTRHLQRGIRQGWDLHPNHLFTRFAATIAYYRADWELTAQRLRDYVAGDTSRWLDEPATAKAMSGYLLRAHACGAITDAELGNTGVETDILEQLRLTGRTA